MENKRTCLLSFRTNNTHVARCSDYEFEDVVLSVDEADIITLEQGSSYSLRKRLVNQSTRHLSELFSGVSPSFTRINLEKRYDLFVAVCEDITDILSINSITNWKQKCEVSICWIDEVWLASLEANKNICQKILSQFDYIYTGCRGSVDRLQELVRKPCRYIAPGVDMLKYVPPRPAQERNIDFYSIGRRPQLLHQQLLALQERQGANYVYDKVSSPKLYVEDYLSHRNNLRGKLQQSRYFIVFPSKFDVPGQTQGQIEFGFRFFEGAAAGTVLIGEPPDSDAFREIFHWDDAVISLPEKAQDLYQSLDSLNSDKERIKQISDKNIYHCLMHHDWAYRWRSLLEVAGFEPLSRLLERERRIKELADFYKVADGE